MKLLKFAVLCISTLAMTNTAYSLSYPKSSGYDSRIQQVKFNDKNVALVKVKVGVATLIQLEDDEYVSADQESTGLGIGDPNAWDIQVRSNNIFLRPIAEQPDTNMLLVTNKRTYSIELKTVDDSPTYILRFNYPPKPKDDDDSISVKNENIAPCTSGYINNKYEVRGSNYIKPIGVWDNGEFTCFKWKNSNDLPVVFRVLSDNKEQLVNYHMDKDIMVVHETSPKFILRLGKDVMEVRSNVTVNRAYNEKGTTNNKYRDEISSKNKGVK